MATALLGADIKFIIDLRLVSFSEHVLDLVLLQSFVPVQDFGANTRYVAYIIYGSSTQIGTGIRYSMDKCIALVSGSVLIPSFGADTRGLVWEPDMAPYLKFSC